MAKNLEGVIKKTSLIAGLLLKGTALYIAYYEGGRHFAKQEYCEAAKCFFILSAPFGFAGTFLLGTSGILYAKSIYRKLVNGKKHD